MATAGTFGELPDSILRQLQRAFGTTNVSPTQVNSWVGSTAARTGSTLGHAWDTYRRTGSWFSPTERPSLSGSNPFFDQRSLYGQQNDLYSSPISQQMSKDIPQGEYERFLLDQGFGGMGQRDQFGRSLYGRFQTGFQAASLTNPNLSFRDYLAGLGPNQLQNIWASQSYGNRGERPNLFAGPVRIIGRG